MADGIVKWFNEIMGFGFIEQKDGPDVVIYSSTIKPAARTSASSSCVEKYCNQL